MKVDYTIVLLVVGLIYAIVKNFFPDFPVSEEVFQILLGYIIVKLGVEIVGKPAEALRKFLG